MVIRTTNVYLSTTTQVSNTRGLVTSIKPITSELHSDMDHECWTI